MFIRNRKASSVSLSQRHGTCPRSRDLLKERNQLPQKTKRSTTRLLLQVVCLLTAVAVLVSGFGSETQYNTRATYLALNGEADGDVDYSWRIKIGCHFPGLSNGQTNRPFTLVWILSDGEWRNQRVGGCDCSSSGPCVVTMPGVAHELNDLYFKEPGSDALWMNYIKVEKRLLNQSWEDVQQYGEDNDLECCPSSDRNDHVNGGWVKNLALGTTKCIAGGVVFRTLASDLSHGNGASAKLVGARRWQTVRTTKQSLFRHLRDERRET